MIKQIQNIEKEISGYQINDSADIEKFRIHFLGSKGLIKGLYTLLREVPNEQKKEFGQKINELKSFAERKLNTFKSSSTQDSQTVIK